MNSRRNDFIFENFVNFLGKWVGGQNFDPFYLTTLVPGRFFVHLGDFVPLFLRVRLFYFVSVLPFISISDFLQEVPICTPIPTAAVGIYEHKIGRHM